MSRRKLALAAAFSLLIGGACEYDPPPPTLNLTVNVDHDLSDTSPGDGFCETTAGGCSLRAAMEEANEHPRAHLDVAVARVNVGDTPLPTLLNTVRIEGTTSPTPRVERSTTSTPILEIAEGAEVHISRMWVMGAVVLNGSLVTERVHIGFSLFGTIPTLAIGPDGRLVARNSRVAAPRLTGTHPSVANEGVAIFDASQIGGIESFLRTPIELGGLATSPGGATYVRSSYLASGCTGSPPSSLSYNADSTSSCDLSAEGDVSEVPETFVYGALEVIKPAEVLDAIPVGINECGTTLVHDLLDELRPQPSAPGAPDQCDIGAFEQSTSA